MLGKNLLAAARTLLSVLLCASVLLTTKQIFRVFREDGKISRFSPTGRLERIFSPLWKKIVVGQNSSIQLSLVTAEKILPYLNATTYSSFATQGTLSRPKCSRTDYLGLSKYVSESCSPEERFPCSNLTCSNLIFGSNTSLYKTAREFMKNHSFPRLGDDVFVNMTKDCVAFRRDRGFEKKMAMDTENFPIAFNLIVHRDVEQIERLIYSLYRPENSFCVHLDLKSSKEVEEAVKGICRCLSNVFLASTRVEVIWGGYNRLQADINCMSDQIRSRTDWKYLINTAGQAFPIRSVREMVEILRIYNGSNDIEGIFGKRVIESRFKYEFEIKNSQVVMKQPQVHHKKPPHDIQIVRGSAYGIFSRRFVEFILTDQRAKDLLEWSRVTFSPDEFYWATLHYTYANPHLHTPGGYSGEPNAKPWLAVYANWFEQPCSGYGRNGVCVFGVEDLPRLVNRKEFFVNKFFTNFEPMALDCLRNWIDYKDSCTGLRHLEVEYYKALPFIKRNH